MATDDNPLLADFDFPPFDRVEPIHVRPAVRTLLARLEGELTDLEKGVQPTWGKLVEPLERIVDSLEVVWGTVDHLKAVKDSSDLRAAVEDVQPDKVKFQLRLGQSKPIYQAFNAIRNSSDWETLSEARKRIVEGDLLCYIQSTLKPCLSPLSS
jgi:oligopeptidase A